MSHLAARAPLHDWRRQGVDPSPPGLRSVRALLFLLAWVIAVGGATVSGGCATTGGPYGPELVYVSPGVQVIADWNEPIFYADGFYWRSNRGAWYRSSYYTGGWVYHPRPPGVILSIHNPHRYRHYRPHGWTSRPRRGAPAMRAAPPYRGGPPPGRGPDFRGAPPRYQHARPPASSPGWRGPSPGRRGAAPAPPPGRSPATRGRPDR